MLGEQRPERTLRKRPGHATEAQHLRHHQEHDDAAVGVDRSEPRRRRAIRHEESVFVKRTAWPATIGGRHEMKTLLAFFTAIFTCTAAEPRLPRDNLLVYRGTDGKPQPVQTLEDWAKRRADIVHGLEAVMGKLPGAEKHCALDV